MIQYLHLDDVLDEHARRIGADLVRDAGQVAATLARPAACFGGTELFPTLVDKAAALLHGFASTQSFVDGNKRMGVYACVAFLLVNGHRLTLSNVEMYDVTMAVADRGIAVEEVAAVLAPAVVPLDLGLD